MQDRKMTADEFKAELRRIKLTQTAFATLSQTPLRTVQSWANGERAIPTTVKAVIEKVEADEIRAHIAAMLETKSQGSLVALSKVVTVFAKDSKRLKQLEERHQKLSAEIKQLRPLDDMYRGLSAEFKNVSAEFRALKIRFERLNETCVFQAEKITAYVKDAERRAGQAKPFNT